MSSSSKVAFFCYFLVFITLTSASLYLPAMTTMDYEFHVTSTVIKYSITAFFIGNLVGAAVSGPLADIFQRNTILTTFFWILVGASLVCAFTPDINVFFVARFFQGLGAVAGQILSRSLMADAYKGPTFDRHMSVLMMLFAICPFFAPFLGSWLIILFDWESTFLFTALMGFFILLYLKFYPLEENYQRRSLSETFPELKELLSNKVFVIYGVMQATLTSGTYIFLLLSPYLFLIKFEWTTHQYAWVGVVLAVGAFFGPFIDRKLVNKLKAKRLFILGLIISGLSSLSLIGFGLFLHISSWTTLILGALFMMGTTVVRTISVTEAMELDQDFKGLASSLLGLSKFIFISLGTAIGAVLPESIPVLGLAFLGLVILNVVLFYLIKKEVSKR